MTDRKPPGVSWQTWIDRQIEAGQAEGRFEDLPGHGKPICGIERPRDELWWVRDKLRREGVDHLPPSLEILRDAADAERRALGASTEADVRGIIEEVNERIRHLNRTSISGPPTTLMPFDVDEVVDRWRRRPADEPPDVDEARADDAPAGRDRPARPRARRRLLSRGWRRSP